MKLNVENFTILEKATNDLLNFESLLILRDRPSLNAQNSSILIPGYLACLSPTCFSQVVLTDQLNRFHNQCYINSTCVLIN